MEASTNLGRVSLVPRGEYDPSSQYERLDVVGYDGSAFLALRSVQGVTPVDGADYMLIARRGSVGATGSVGPQGEQGIPGVQGPKGDKGDPGSSIAGIERTDGTGAPGTTDTYTITLTDGSTSTFQVRNGADGDGAGDMTKSVYDPQGKNTDVFAYIDEKVKDAPAFENLVTVPSGGEITLPDTLGAGPYTFEFEEDGEGSAVDAAQVAYDGSESGVEAETVQGALDLLNSRKADADRVSNPNLLDNWYFIDPINQRGQKEYTGVGYTIDRWKIVDDNTKILIGNGYITIEKKGSGVSQFLQYTEIPIALKDHIFTLSILDTNNVLTSITQKPSDLIVVSTPFGGLTVWVYNGDKIGVNISLNNADSMSIVAAKLELGPTQTLAHQDADGNWVLNDPLPDKNLERAKCQRYQVFGPLDSVHTTHNNNKLSVAFLPLGVPLRGMPTMVGTPSVWTVDGAMRIDNVTITPYDLASNGIYLRITGSDAPCYVSFKEGAGLDANL